MMLLQMTVLERANTRIKNSTEAEFKKTTKGYDSVVTAASSMRLSESTEHYALYPVWNFLTQSGMAMITCLP